MTGMFVRFPWPPNIEREHTFPNGSNRRIESFNTGLSIRRFYLVSCNLSLIVTQENDDELILGH
jgi:hypothetical protein